MLPDDLLICIRVVLCRPGHPGNIGAAARAMKTMGLSRLSLIAPRRWDLAAREEALARAAGAEDLLIEAELCDDLDTALRRSVLTAGLSARQRDLGPTLYDARSAASFLCERLDSLDLRLAIAVTQGGTGILPEAALLFGNESSGLSNDELSACRVLIQIPSDPDFASLNLAAAVQLMCYELRMAAFNKAKETPPAPRAATIRAVPPATHAELVRLHKHLLDTMERSRFYDTDRPRRLPAKLWLMLQRGGLSREEVSLLRGVLTAVGAYLPENNC